MKPDKSNAMECVGAIRSTLNRLVISEISYGDYDCMTDWIGDIEAELERLEKKEKAMKPVDKKTEYACGQCDTHVAYKDDYCWKCGQKLDWEEMK